MTQGNDFKAHNSDPDRSGIIHKRIEITPNIIGPSPLKCFKSNFTPYGNNTNITC